ncbi:T-cell immunoglobulin and mucin domain-containing protein 4-like [Centroberyx affinis]|uniref:T-cell immunoglobulin and mucin domain-containing protein 4-like n=1 Tax=Centroberyx affinis TaxID=166261 RepID=UPI003A5C7148
MKTGTRSGCLLLLCLLTVSESSSLKVVGHAGQNVTLPCEYNIRTHGSAVVCWGRGEIPNAGCNDQIIATDGSKVTEESRRSSRFQLLGRLRDGDVSLTILNATPRDSGRYGCRVQVPGWFNDLRYHSDLTDQLSPEQQLNRLESFVGNSVRLAFTVFMPALLLVAVYRVWSSKRRAETSRSLTLSDQEESSV